MLGYKGFKRDLTCRGFQYEIGKTYTMDPQEIQLCSKGFHFCQIPLDVLMYYDAEDNLYAMVKAEGNILHDTNKSVASQLTVIKLITREELTTSQNGLFVRANRRKEWYKNGQFHCLDGPAIEYNNGDKHWYQNGLLHRLDGPAQEYVNGDKLWYQNGQLHRLDGPAIEHLNGDKEWYQNGQHHRLDGPAIELADGEKHWYQNGQRHRLDGPAIEGLNGYKAWYQNGKFIV
jgi:hypothetical protein